MFHRITKAYDNPPSFQPVDDAIAVTAMAWGRRPDGTYMCVATADRLLILQYHKHNMLFITKKVQWTVWFGLCLMTPGLSKDIRCHEWPYFSKLTNHQIRHQATHKVGCQPGNCMWSF